MSFCRDLWATFTVSFKRVLFVVLSFYIYFAFPFRLAAVRLSFSKDCEHESRTRGVWF